MTDATPTSYLKKRSTLSDLALKKTLRKTQEGKGKPAKKKFVFKRAERIVNEARSCENESIRLKRVLNRPFQGESPAEHTLGFVFRIRSALGTQPQTQKILKLLRLHNMYTGVFLEFNKSTIQLLQMVGPYVCYGTPSVRNVKDLIYKRAYCRPPQTKADDKFIKIPLVDNTLVEEHLGEFGMICVEDLVHEILQCDVSKNFKKAVHFLAPFDLSTPSMGNTKLLVKQEKVLSGYQPEKISELIAQMV